MATVSPHGQQSEFNARSISVLAVSMVGLVMSFSPIFISTLPVLMKGIGSEFGWDRTTVMGGQTAPLLAIFVIPFVGRMIDRLGPRIMILSCTAIYGLAVLALSRLGPTYWLFLLLAFVIGCTGGSAAAPLGYVSLLSRWFNRRLGAAIGIANMGVGLGAMLTPILVHAVDAAYGWRWAYVVLGGLVLGIALPGALLFARERPADAADSAADQPSDPSEPLMTVPEVLRQPVFWAFALSNYLMMMAVIGCSAHLYPMLTDRGFSGASAAQMVSGLGLSLLLARLAAGIVLDYVPTWIVGTLTFAGVGLGALLLSFAPDTAGVMIAIVLIGGGQGIEGDLLPFVVRRAFGMRNFATCYGLVAIPFGAGAATGPLIAAQFFDRGAGYTPAFMLFALAGFLSAAIMATFVRRGMTASRIGAGRDFGPSEHQLEMQRNFSANPP